LLLISCAEYPAILHDSERREVLLCGTIGNRHSSSLKKVIEMPLQVRRGSGWIVCYICRVVGGSQIGPDSMELVGIVLPNDRGIQMLTTDRVIVMRNGNTCRPMASHKDLFDPSILISPMRRLVGSTNIKRRQS
jgi:hypothetical protein